MLPGKENSVNKPKRIKLSDEQQREREIDNTIDDWIEQKHITEVPTICEGTGEDYA